MNPQEDQRDQETNQHWRRSERKHSISRVEYSVVLCPQHRQLRKRSSMARVPAGPQPPLHPNTRCSALIHILISTGNVTQLLPNICFCEATRGLGVGNQGEWATLSSGTEIPLTIVKGDSMQGLWHLMEPPHAYHQTYLYIYINTIDVLKTSIPWTAASSSIR